MGKTRSAEVFKRNNVMIGIIKEHKGKDNSIGIIELCNKLKELGYNAKPDNVHNSITKLKLERHLPICSANARGYYWAVKKDDILGCIAHLESRVESLNDHINHLKSFIIE